MRAARVIAISTLIFLGIGSVVGGVLLILDPSGRMLYMPVSLLQYSPFRSFLVQGILLLVTNGLLSFAVLALTVRHRAGYGWWVVLQGCVLFGWISVEVILLRFVAWPHYVYRETALVLMVVGFVLRCEEKVSQAGNNPPSEADPN